MPFEITIKGPAPTSKRVLTFSASPVRIGRNQLNDIPLDDPFVSEWHGMIRFSDEGVAYFDLGSTNGSILDGARVPKNVPAPLTASSRILLGRIELAITNQSKDTGPRKTIAWGHPGDPNRSGPPRPSGSSARSVPDSGGVGKSGGEKPRGAGTDENTSAAISLQRREKLLEAFIEAFVGLRKGYEQFGAEVGVRTINGRTPLHRARTGKEILDHLLEPGVDLSEATRDLIAIFADFGIHHIAMMEAVTEGVRALLQSLDPRANDLDVGGRLFSASKAKNQWRAYLERFDQALTEDQELHAAIFGAEFARAYARVTVGDGSKRPDPDAD
jgi:predicted component of type VI protein secretion system